MPNLTSLLLLLGAACQRPVGDPAPTCPQAWTPHDGACTPLLPDATGVSLAPSIAPLDPGELSEAEQLALAERFQPALIFAGPQIWPVPVAYCAESGADLLVYSDEDEGHVSGSVAVANEALPGTDLSALPGEGLIYGLDCPGDNTGPGYEDATWLTEWDRIQGASPATAPYPPTHYAHLAWYDRSAALLLIQYWAWYPFDKFANNHEGDWEHINAVVSLAEAEPALVDVHWFFHGLSFQSFQRISRVTDADGGDHVVVFAGGCGEFDGWGGCYSGASYPWPGQYVDAALLVVEDTRPQARALHPDDIAVTLLPEPDAPEGLPLDISWLALNIFFGQWEVEANPSAILAFGGNDSAPQPVHKGSWDEALNDDPWQGEEASTFSWFEPPEGWEMRYNPGHDPSVLPDQNF